ncbi:MAG: M20/M25/M40 family metallo-hydrolase [Anaerolineales bacterium]|nr:M20/M25/M40 family metallo-hydrolase [Anaerolineales bacterium]
MSKATFAPYRDFFENNLPHYLDILRQMVEINSFTANSDGVRALADLTANVFSPLGFHAEYVPSANPEYGVHLVMKRNGKGDKKLAFVSHLDTVYPVEDEIHNDFHWREEDERIYGPGTVDIKGGTVMIYMILEAIRQFQPDVFETTNWYVLLNASEETMTKDFGQVALSHLPGDTLACLIFEGGIVRNGGMKLVTNRKGMAVYRVTTEGKSAHAGSSHPQGANAIAQMAHIVLAIEEMTDYEKNLTFNVGKISGGTVTNRVPHFAEIRVEMRTFETEVFEDGLAKMFALQDRADVTSKDGYPCKVMVELLSRTEPWNPNPGSDRLLEIWQEAGDKLGMKVGREIRGGLSDGNLLWHKFPTIDALGPDGGNAHSSERSADGSKDQEYVTVSSFVPKAWVNTVAVLKILT